MAAAHRPRIENPILLCYTVSHRRLISQPTNRKLQDFTHQEGSLTSIELARRLLEIVEDKQASDIVLLDIRELTAIADYFVIGTVSSERQAAAIEDEVLAKLKLEQNIRPLAIEGKAGSAGGWLLLDYADVIVHLFEEEARDYYKLEELWGEAKVVVKVM